MKGSNAVSASFNLGNGTSGRRAGIREKGTSGQFRVTGIALDKSEQPAAQGLEKGWEGGGVDGRWQGMRRW